MDIVSDEAKKYVGPEGPYYCANLLYKNNVIDDATYVQFVHRAKCNNTVVIKAIDDVLKTKNEQERTLFLDSMVKSGTISKGIAQKKLQENNK